MNRQGPFFRTLRNQSGVAAIEMALILPILLIVFLGLIDLTNLLSDNRRLSNSAHVLADIVSRFDSPTTPVKIDEAFSAFDIIMEATPASIAGAASAAVFNYTKNSSGDVVLKWSREQVGSGGACAAPDATYRNSLANLMTLGNDVIVVVSCTVHAPLMANLISETILGPATFALREQIAMRPRQTLKLDCTGC